MKQNCHLIAQPLKLLLNQSFQQGKFPNRLKHAQVTPLYKKGAKTDPNNYRPISLLNVFSKIFEKIMKNKFMHFIDSNNILTKSKAELKTTTQDRNNHTSHSRIFTNPTQRCIK